MTGSLLLDKADNPIQNGAEEAECDYKVHIVVQSW